MWLCVAGALGAEIWIPGDAASLTEALALATAADVVVVDTALDESVTILAPITIRGTAQGSITHASAVLTVDVDGVVLEDLALLGPGRCINAPLLAGETLRMTNVSCIGSNVDQGALNLTGGNAVMIGGSFTSNTSGTYPPIYISDASLEVTGLSCSNNSSYYGGCALVQPGGLLTVADSDFAGNYGGAYGGALYCNSSSVCSVSDSRFVGNAAGAHAGAIYTVGTSLDVQGAVFDGNSAANSGALFCQAASGCTISGTIFSNNSATNGVGGAIYAYSSRVIVDDSVVCGNTASSQGGGIYAYYPTDLTVRGTALVGNTGVDHGGGIQVTGGTGTFTDVSFVDNEVLAPIGGPALGLWGISYATVRNNLFVANRGAGLTPVTFQGGSTPASGDVDYNSYYGNALEPVPVANERVGLDPLFFSPAGACSADLRPTSFAFVTPADPTLVGVMGAYEPIDLDGDGSGSADDCDDDDATAYPTAPMDGCDGVDNDCDGVVDEDPDRTWYEDQDGDGFSTGVTAVQCAGPPGFVETVAVGVDCADQDLEVNPGAPELCDGTDQDCDGVVDEGLLVATYFEDLDLDGFGGNITVETCDLVPGLAAIGGDCDETESSVHPEAAELCDGIDQDCDGVADDGLPEMDTWRDVDGDGFGAGLASFGCVEPGWVAVGGDCDDAVAEVNPAAMETCNARDDDCDTAVDEGARVTWYTDADGDGVGVGEAMETCEAPDGSSEVDGDCDDDDPEVWDGCDSEDLAPRRSATGCSCESGGAPLPGGLLVLVILLGGRRRAGARG